MGRKTIPDFIKMAEEGTKMTWITGYDYLTAKYEERAGVDMILVGDSAKPGQIYDALHSGHDRAFVY